MKETKPYWEKEIDSYKPPKRTVGQHGGIDNNPNSGLVPKVQYDHCLKWHSAGAKVCIWCKKKNPYYLEFFERK